MRDGQIYISLKGLKKKVEDYKKESTTNPIEQNILLLPKY